MTAFDELARRAGIVGSFIDARGRRCDTSADTAKAILKALGFVGDPTTAARELEDIDRREWLTSLGPVTVHRGGGPPAVMVTLAQGVRDCAWTVSLEDGTTRSGRLVADACETVATKTIDGVVHVRHRMIFPEAMPFGYHTLTLGTLAPGDTLAPAGGATNPDAGKASMRLIVAPDACWLPDAVMAPSRIWGLTAQLYLLRSGTNWGIGDFGDLRTLVDVLRPLGADVIGLNPLHAMFLDAPERASPYSPASRLLLNVLNIDVATLVTQLDDANAAELIARDAFQRRVESCRESPTVRYAVVAELKLAILRCLFAGIRKDRRSAASMAIDAWEANCGAAQREHHTFLALREHFTTEGSAEAEWQHWPPEFRDPRSAAVKSFAETHSEAVTFHAWTQQVADQQLEAAARGADGMAIGLYRDLAVGADRAGAETWANQTAVVMGAQVGAPPDIYNPHGQDWGLPPFNPRALRDEGYASFIDMIRANMRHAGGLRIDHVMGLLQIYWVPEGMDATRGAYVKYPLEDLLGVLALESHRHRCIVVGEDLGTVPEGFREQLSRARVLSYRVLFFEKDDHGYIDPAHYPELALAVASSHDLPTLNAWLEAKDLDLKRDLKLFPTPEEAERASVERRDDRLQLQTALRGERVEKSTASEADRFYAAAHMYLARSRSAIATVQIDDVSNETSPVNVPATSDEYPNWRRRLSLSLEELAASPRLRAVAEAFNQERSKERT